MDMLAKLKDDFKTRTKGNDFTFINTLYYLPEYSKKFGKTCIGYSDNYTTAEGEGMSR